MERQRQRSTRLAFLMVVMACLASTTSRGQCSNKITHLSGTQQLGCHLVTVTPGGATSTAASCGHGPYLAGLIGNNGSYTFTFSPPVDGVSIDISALNHHAGSEEELSIEINGVFYPLTVPGTPDNCLMPAIITPMGRIGALFNQDASWKNIPINTLITTLKVENIILQGTPAGTSFSVFFCSACCATESGQMISDPLHVCQGNTAVATAATNTFLDSDDLLRYILFSNPADTLGSILSTNVIPAFGFNPATMQTGVTYYIAAIAGNNLNGNVNLTDPCLDISNSTPVTWHPRPAVSFAADNPNVCAGACTTVTANFTGTAPFSLTYTVPGGGPVTQTFSENTSTFQVCTPANSAPGSLTVQATSLMDAWCPCTN